MKDKQSVCTQEFVCGWKEMFYMTRTPVQNLALAMADLDGAVTSTCNDTLSHNQKAAKCTELLIDTKQSVRDIESNIKRLEGLVPIQGRSKNYKALTLETRNLLATFAISLSEIVDSNHYDHQVFFD